jgi:hypothetical protein
VYNQFVSNFTQPAPLGASDDVKVVLGKCHPTGR